MSVTFNPVVSIRQHDDAKKNKKAISPASVGSASVSGSRPVHFGNAQKELPSASMADFFKANFDAEQALKTSEVISVEELYNKILQDPTPVFSAHQRLYTAVDSYGTEKVKNVFGRTVTRYNMFTERSDVAPNPIRGADEALEKMMNAVRHGLDGSEKGRRVILLLGDAGSGKTESINILKRGVSAWSVKNPVYALKWENLPPDIKKVKGEEGEEDLDPKMSNPLLLLPLEVRKKLQAQLNKKFYENKENEGKKLDFPILSLTEDELSGRSARIRDLLLDKELKALKQEKSSLSKEEALTQASWNVIQKYASAQRIVIDEGTGIGYLDAKDPQWFDTTTITGDVNPAGEARYGSAKDARAFDYGRGKIYDAQGVMFHFDEILKTKEAHLLSFLQIGQEGRVQGVSGVRERVNTVIFATSNLPDYLPLRKKKENRAFFQRFNIIKFPYTGNKKDELQIYEDTHKERFERENIHVAPHALETAALFAVMSRLEVPDGEKTSILPLKADLYAGEFQKHSKNKPSSEDSLVSIAAKWKAQAERAKEDAGQQEGFFGISTRSIAKDFLTGIIDSPFLGEPGGERTLDGFAMINALSKELDEDGIFQIPTEQERNRYKAILTQAKARLEQAVTEDVKAAIETDEEALGIEFNNYIRRVEKWVDYELSGEPYDHINEQNLRENIEAGNKAMAKIEEKMGLKTPEAQRPHRITLKAVLGNSKKAKVTLDNNPELKKAISEVLTQARQMGRISPETITAENPTEKEKIQTDNFYRLMKKKGYNRTAALHALQAYQRVVNSGN